MLDALNPKVPTQAQQRNEGNAKTEKMSGSATSRGPDLHGNYLHASARLSCCPWNPKTVSDNP
jgi:hypothetical protein